MLRINHVNYPVHSVPSTTFAFTRVTIIMLTDTADSSATATTIPTQSHNNYTIQKLTTCKICSSHSGVMLLLQQSRTVQQKTLNVWQHSCYSLHSWQRYYCNKSMFGGRPSAVPANIPKKILPQTKSVICIKRIKRLEKNLRAYGIGNFKGSGGPPPSCSGGVSMKLYMTTSSMLHNMMRGKLQFFSNMYNKYLCI